MVVEIALRLLVEPPEVDTLQLDELYDFVDFLPRLVSNRTKADEQRSDGHMSGLSVGGTSQLCVANPNQGRRGNDRAHG